jgi:hypothetical protein
VARGWESKDIESQREAAEAEKRSGRQPAPDPAEVERDSRRNSLLLSRTHILHELEATRHQRRRAQLQAALEHLDAELKRLQSIG